MLRAAVVHLEVRQVQTACKFACQKVTAPDLLYCSCYAPLVPHVQTLQLPPEVRAGVSSLNTTSLPASTLKRSAVSKAGELTNPVIDLPGASALHPAAAAAALAASSAALAGTAAVSAAASSAACLDLSEPHAAAPTLRAEKRMRLADIAHTSFHEVMDSTHGVPPVPGSLPTVAPPTPLPPAAALVSPSRARSKRARPGASSAAEPPALGSGDAGEPQATAAAGAGAVPRAVKAALAGAPSADVPTDWSQMLSYTVRFL